MGAALSLVTATQAGSLVADIVTSSRQNCARFLENRRGVRIRAETTGLMQSERCCGRSYHLQWDHQGALAVDIEIIGPRGPLRNLKSPKRSMYSAQTTARCAQCVRRPVTARLT